jgi:prepilin-type processing-associated H-X9-DG protein/prepilin-type N-terminal cleavage/methylation domain-containing protein
MGVLVPAPELLPLTALIHPNPQNRGAKVRCDPYRRPAFTLVEILVVIAIIGVLVALLLPAIAAARAAAQSSQCQNNLRQLGLAVIQYRDQNGAYPQYRAEYPPITNAYGVQRPRWQWILAPQLGGWAQNPDSIRAAGIGDPTYTYVPLDNKTLICPSMDSSSANTYSIRNGSYGYNFGYLGNNRTMVDGDNTTPTLRYPVTSVKEPTRTIVFADSRGGAIPHGGHSMTLDPPHMVVRQDNLTVNSPYWLQAPFNGAALAGVNPYGPDEGTPDITVPFSPAQARHAGKANVAFLDGHVESLTLDALGYVTLNGIPVLQTTAVPVSGSNNALWTGRGLDEYSPAYGIDAP